MSPMQLMQNNGTSHISWNNAQAYAVAAMTLSLIPISAFIAAWC